MGYRKKLLSVAISLATISPSALGNDNGMLEEVIVTANRRAAALEDIPYNISAVSGDTIRNAGVGNLLDLTRMIPGLTSADFGPRNASVSSSLVIRGLSSAGGGAGAVLPNVSVPLVSTYVDDTPLFVNLKLTDIARVEVLRGPQGTLYGSGSMGGTVRIIHQLPDTDNFSAEVSSKVSFTDEADDPSYSVEGIINLPLSDTVALRVSGGYDKISGYIDATSRAVLDAAGQPVLADPSDPLNSGLTFAGEEDVDEADTSHIRLALSADVTDDVNVLLAYNRQEDSADDSSIQTPGAGDYESAQLVGDPLDRDVDLYSMDINVDLGFASFTSASSYSQNESNGSRDLTGVMEDINQNPFAYGGYPRVVSTMVENTDETSWVQEFRLVSQSEGSWDWVVGGFYRKQEIELNLDPQFLHGFDAWSELPGSADLINEIIGVPGLFANFGDFVQFANGAPRPSSTMPTDNVFSLDRNVDFEDIAVFGELTYHFTDNWQVTVGARQFWQDFEQSMVQKLPVCGPACSDSGMDPSGTITSEVKKDFQDNVFKFNTSYDINDNTMAYFTWSEGFRHGGANGLAIGTCFLCEADDSLLAFDSDTATNTELGIKGTALDNTLRYTVSVFHVDWQDIQIDSTTTPGGFPLVINGGDAVSKGLELELTSQLGENLSLTFGYTYVDAELKDDFVVEAVVGRDGDKLPAVPENQLSLSVDYFLPLSTAGRELHFHLGGSYRDKVTTAFNDSIFIGPPPGIIKDAEAATFRELDAYSIWGTSVNFLTSNWRAGLFVDNLTNEEGISAVGRKLEYEYVARPRTIGLSFVYNWE